MAETPPPSIPSPVLVPIGRSLSTQAVVPQVDLRASIIIVSYNSWPHLERCLESLHEAQHRDTEIIVVDNASPDGSAAGVDRCFPAVRLVANRSNAGFGAACNLGARHARGEYLAFLNPDARPEPGWLEALIAALQADSQAGMATSQILLLDAPQRLNACGNDVHISALTLCRGVSQPCSGFSRPGEVGAVSGAAFAIRRGLFEALGGFDPPFFLYMEDTDLSWRARLAGWRILYVPGSRVYHDYALRFGPHKTFYQERNRYRMLLKCLRWGTLLVLLPVLLLAEVVVWGFCLLRDRRGLRGKIRAYAWLARNWGGLMGARRRTQALRRVPDRRLLEATCSRLDFAQTGDGPAARLAHWVFNPLFACLKGLAMLLIRW